MDRDVESAFLAEELTAIYERLTVKVTCGTRCRTKHLKERTTRLDVFPQTQRP